MAGRLIEIRSFLTGIVAIFLAPPKETTEESQVASEELMFNEVQDPLMTESFEEHQQRIKKKGERLAAYIKQELKVDDNKIQL